MTHTAAHNDTPEVSGPKRRTLLSVASILTMLGGLAGGYGMFAYIAGRFLYPLRGRIRQWLFVAEANRLRPGESLRYRAPSGETINITRQDSTGNTADFIALSSTCPHLGCQVHWQPQQQRYFCPCHNGVFDPSGKGIGGPPGDAGQSLPRYSLKIDGRLLFIAVPIDDATSAAHTPEGGLG